MKPPHRLAVSILLAILALILAACGDGVPKGAVAKVGDEEITKASFDQWFETAVRAAQPPGPPAAAVVAPDPPQFTKCIAAAREAAGPEATPPPTEAALKSQCKTQYDLLKGQVMQFLLQAAAIDQEAQERGLSVTDAEVQSEFDKVRDETFQKPQDYAEFLESSGRSEEDLLFQTRLDLLSQRLREDVLAGAPDPSDAQIQAYYEENGDQPPAGTPATRDLLVILTEDEQAADEAVAKLEDGAEFDEIVKEYSIDEVSKQDGGKLAGVERSGLEPALGEAAFTATKEEIGGPIETELGWYVFRVIAVRRGSKPPLEEIRPAIVEALSAESDQERLTAFVDGFQTASVERANCAEGYEVQGCKNGPPAPKPGSAAPGGAPPAQSGAPPAGPPSNSPDVNGPAPQEGRNGGS